MTQDLCKLVQFCIVSYALLMMTVESMLWKRSLLCGLLQFSALPPTDYLLVWTSLAQVVA